GSAVPANGSVGKDLVGVHRGPVGKRCMSVSMTPLVSPTSRCSPTNAPRPRWGSSNARSSGSRSEPSRSARCSPTTARRTGHTRGRSGARRIASSISAPVPTGPAPTAKPNGSSKPCCANGPTPGRIAAQPTELVHCPPGSTTTTTNDHTAPSVTRHPPAGFTPTDQRQWELQLALALLDAEQRPRVAAEDARLGVVVEAALEDLREQVADATPDGRGVEIGTEH